MDQQRSPNPRRRIRSDGWTPERQIRFLDALQRTRNVSKAAEAAGMSRESAYRLCGRRDGALFAALWDRILAPQIGSIGQGHIEALSDGALLRLLGNHYRRESGEFAAFARRAADSRRK